MRGLLKTGGPGKPPVRPKGQKDLQGKNMRESSDYVEQTGGTLIMGQLLLSLLSGIQAPPMPSSACLSFLLCSHRGWWVRGRTLSKPAERGRPEQLEHFLLPAPLRGRGRTLGTTFPTIPMPPPPSRPVGGGCLGSGSLGPWIGSAHLPIRPTPCKTREPNELGVQGPGQLLPALRTPPPPGARSTWRSLLAPTWPRAEDPRHLGLPRLLHRPPPCTQYPLLSIPRSPLLQ